jgi:hypothetical protein
MPSRLVRPFRFFRLPDNNQIIVSSTNQTVVQIIKQSTVGQGTFVACWVMHRMFLVDATQETTQE